MARYIDYARHGVRVNALLPGPTETPLMWANVPEAETGATREQVRREVPLARLADPAEIARAVLGLLSDATNCSWSTCSWTCSTRFPEADTALRVVADWRDLDPVFVETPLWPDDLDGYRRLSTEQPIPIAAGSG